jgi:hypothetical protein
LSCRSSERFVFQGLEGEGLFCHVTLLPITCRCEVRSSLCYEHLYWK